MLFATPAFHAALRAQHTKPYLVLGVDWTNGTEFYLDREPTSFSATGRRCPAGAIKAVDSWGSIRQELREGQINSTDQVTVTLWDGDKRLLSRLNAAPQQRRRLRIWLMFDEPGVVWPTDAVLLFVGAIQPATWKETDQHVELSAVDASSLLVGDVGKRAAKSVFPLIEPAYEDRPLPIAWGLARRVPAILIQRPWVTQAFQAVPVGVPPVTFEILDHPSDLGVRTGNDHIYAAWLGVDQVEGYFTQSPSPDSFPSTFTITSQPWAVMARNGFQILGVGASLSRLHLQKSKFNPRYFDYVTQLVPEIPVRVTQHRSAFVTYTTIKMTIDPGVYGRDWVSVELNDALPNNESGQIELLDPFSVRRPWPEGTQLSERGADYIYLFNMLPSRSVQLVEGFGTLVDESGASVKDFVTLLSDTYTHTVNDNRWGAKLGHNVSTVTFKMPPTYIAPELDTNEIWVTCHGTVQQTPQQTFWVHPSDMIQEYLRSPHLMNLSEDQVDVTSFNEVKASLPDVRFGFAQIEIRRGLELLQELAHQARCIIQFSAGKARLVELRNSPGPIRQRHDRTTITARSLARAETSVRDLVSIVQANWRRDWDNRTGERLLSVVKFHPAAMAQYGRNQQALSVYALSARQQVDDLAAFWLAHLARLPGIFELQCFMPSLLLQPGDWIGVTYTDGEGFVHFSGTPLEVIAVNYNPGGGGTAPLIGLTLRGAVSSGGSGSSSVLTGGGSLPGDEDMIDDEFLEFPDGTFVSPP